MKKHFIVPVTLMAISFSACSPAKPKKKHSSSVEPTTAQSITSTLSEAPTQTSAISITSNSSTSDTVSSTSSHVVQEYTQYFKLFDTDFTNASGFPAAGGVKIDDEQYPKNVEKLYTYFSNSVAYPDLINLPNCVNVNITKAVVDTPYFMLGSANDNGVFKFNSTAKMYKIIVQATMYYKYVEYTGVTNYDEGAKFVFNEDVKSLEFNQETQKGVQLEYTFEDSNGVNEFFISSIDGRVMISSLEITWHL